MRPHPTNIKNALVKISISAWYLLTISGFLGCEEIVTNIDFPETKPKIVVHSFISPADTAAQVMLSWSIPVTASISKDSIHYIDHARVRMAGPNNTFVDLDYHAGKKVYYVSTNSMALFAGGTYQLQVEVPGQPSLHASCYIPQTNQTLTVESLEREDLGWSERLKVTYEFTDVPGVKPNYYAPSVWLDNIYYYFDEDTIDQGRSRFSIVSGESYLSNIGREGRQFRFRAETYDFQRMPETSNTIGGDSIFLLLLTTDEHYYRYHKDLESYVPENPFAEPVHIYSNIEGGLGVFAGFNRFEVVMALP